MVVEQIALDPGEQLRQLKREPQRLAELIAIQRIRSGERRLLTLLCWTNASHGQLSRQGCRRSLRELNFTHRVVADLCGMTPVTVSKSLRSFRAEGLLVTVSSWDLLIPNQA